MKSFVMCFVAVVIILFAVFGVLHLLPDSSESPTVFDHLLTFFKVGFKSLFNSPD